MHACLTGDKPLDPRLILELKWSNSPTWRNAFPYCGTVALDYLGSYTCTSFLWWFLCSLLALTSCQISVPSSVCSMLATSLIPILLMILGQFCKSSKNLFPSPTLTQKLPLIVLPTFATSVRQDVAPIQRYRYKRGQQCTVSIECEKTPTVRLILGDKTPWRWPEHCVARNTISRPYDSSSEKYWGRRWICHAAYSGLVTRIFIA